MKIRLVAVALALAAALAVPATHAAAATRPIHTPNATTPHLRSAPPLHVRLPHLRTGSASAPHARLHTAAPVAGVAVVWVWAVVVDVDGQVAYALVPVAASAIVPTAVAGTV